MSVFVSILASLMCNVTKGLPIKPLCCFTIIAGTLFCCVRLAAALVLLIEIHAWHHVYYICPLKYDYSTLNFKK